MLLRDSGICPEVAAARGYFTALTKAQLRDLGFPGSQQRVPSLVLPIFDIRGELATYQLRPDSPRLGKNGKPTKYETKFGASVVLDVPKSARTWVKDPGRPLFITEGVRKSDAAASKGLACVALLGVWNFRDGRGVLPDWEYIPLKSRKVYVCFDSDVMEKREVHDALARLRAVLQGRGADVRLIYLPAGEGGSKVGLDDYLASHSVDELLPCATDELRAVVPQDEGTETRPELPPAEPRTLDEVVACFRRWLHLPDLRALYALLGAVAANRMAGPPVWLLIVGPPGNGKTELLQSLVTLPDVHRAATLTEASLLSGTPRKEHATGAQGGLLRAIGGFGFLVFKDFTSILSMHREARGGLLAALREIYDGEWTRHVGVDGGQTLSWTGKVAVLAGCTQSIDQHHAVMGSMGERFLLFRQPVVEGREQTLSALGHAGREGEMRAELVDAVRGLFAGISLPDRPPEVNAAEREELVRIASVAVRCRSAVQRDGYNREIELIPDPEAPARMALALNQLFAGMICIGVERPMAWSIVSKIALDCMPALRRSLLDALDRKSLSTFDAAAAVGYPVVTARRALEDLEAHHVVKRTGDGRSKKETWQLVPDVANAVRAATVPETSGTFTHMEGQ